jgi:hypothetical protein
MTLPRRSTPWALPKLLAANRNALTVYAVLRFLAGDSRRYATTRQRIADVCGLSLRSIGEAVQALDEAGWLTMNYGRQGLKSWYRLTFPVVGFFPVVRKTYHSKPKSVSKNIPQQTVCCVSKNSTHSLNGVGASYGPAPTPTGGAERTPTQGAVQHLEKTDCGGGPTRPITEILGITK